MNKIVKTNPERKVAQTGVKKTNPERDLGEKHEKKRTRNVITEIIRKKTNSERNIAQILGKQGKGTYSLSY